MEGPQKENGYTAIANEIMEVLCSAKFNGSQHCIILAVIRYTYGFNRKSAEMSISYLTKATGLPERHVRKELARLIEDKVLIEYKKPTKNSSREIGFNKYYSEWCKCTRGANIPEEQKEHSREEQLMHSREEQLLPQEIQPKYNIKEIYILSVQKIFSHWNQQNITVHKEMTPEIQKTAAAALKKYEIDIILLAITRYSEIYNDAGYYFKHKWTLLKFLTQNNCIPDFLDEGEKWINYQNRSNYGIIKGLPTSSVPLGGEITECN